MHVDVIISHQRKKNQYLIAMHTHNCAMIAEVMAITPLTTSGSETFVFGLSPPTF